VAASDTTPPTSLVCLSDQQQQDDPPPPPINLVVIIDFICYFLYLHFSCCFICAQNESKNIVIMLSCVRVLAASDATPSACLTNNNGMNPTLEVGMAPCCGCRTSAQYQNGAAFLSSPSTASGRVWNVAMVTAKATGGDVGHDTGRGVGSQESGVRRGLGVA
jgi:hypothetical protein